MKKREIKTGKRILSAILAFAMTGTMISLPVSAEDVVDITTYQLDLSDKFNYSNWGILGETITSDTFVPDTRASFLFPKGGSTVDTFKLNDEISFKFDTATYSANVNNYYKADASETAVFTGHESFVKDVYMGVALYNQSSGNISFAITYTDGTKETQTVFIKNKTQLNGVAAESLPANYVGAMDISKAHLGSVGYRKTKNDNGVVAAASSSDGLAFYKIDVDETKTIDNIAIANTDSVQVGFYAIGGTVMRNAELMAYVDNVKAFDSVTPENSDQIIVAKGYADELIERNAATAADMSKIYTLYEEVAWYEQKTDQKQNMVDLSGALNIEMLAPVGTVVDKYFDVTECTNTTSWANKISGGVINVTTTDGDTVSFSMDSAKLTAGTKDAVYLEGAGESVTINSVGEKSEYVYFIWGSQGDRRNPVVKVNYSDGTSHTQKMSICKYVSIAQDTQAVGSIMLDWNGYYPAKDEETGKYILTSKSATGGVIVYRIALDVTKNPVSYEITPDVQYGTAIFAMTEVTMSNDDMIAAIDALKEIDFVRTDEEAEAVQLAWAYAEELDRRHVVRLEDNAFLAKLVKQANAQKDINIDLSSMVDTDLIVNVGDNRPANYSGRNDALYQTMGDSVTVIAPRNEDYTDKDTGRTFKLSGGYDGNGNDSVKAGSQEVEIGIGNKLLKRVSILTDCIDKKVNKQTGTSVTVTITYNDGTNEDVVAQLRRSDTWHTNQYGAFKTIKYAHYEEESNSYAEGRLSVDPEDDYSLLSCYGFNIPLAKPVKNITIGADEYNYHILAVTAVPYSNTELEEGLAIFEEVTCASDVSDENAKAALEGSAAAFELYARGYELDEESLAMVQEVYAAALVYLADGEVLSFEPTSAIADNSVTAKVVMSNTTQNDAPYVLIIAAYDDDNKLVGVKATQNKTLSKGSIVVSDSVSIEIPDTAVSYKAMVWKSLSMMQPYAVTATN